MFERLVSDEGDRPPGSQPESAGERLAVWDRSTLGVKTLIARPTVRGRQQQFRFLLRENSRAVCTGAKGDKAHAMARHLVRARPLLD